MENEKAFLKEIYANLIFYNPRERLKSFQWIKFGLSSDPVRQIQGFSINFAKL